MLHPFLLRHIVISNLFYYYSTNPDLFYSGKVVNLPPTIATDLIRPILAPLYSEAFSFSKCHAMRKVPNDPFMEIFYDGDEFAKFLR